MIRTAFCVSAALLLNACSGEGGGAAKVPAAPTVAAAPGPLTGAGFVSRMAQSDLFEVHSSRMARTRAPDVEVKRYAQEMMDAHGQTTADMSTLIAGVEGAVIPVKLDAAGEAKLLELRRAAPADFEALYLKQQIDAHRAAAKLLDDFAAGGDDEGLKVFAAKTAPMVKGHLATAEKLAGDGA